MLRPSAKRPEGRAARGRPGNVWQGRFASNIEGLTTSDKPYRDLQNLKFSCLYLFPFSHKVVPQKASGGGGGRGEGRIPHFNWSI